jgi:hypothetical protein
MAINLGFLDRSRYFKLFFIYRYLTSSLGKGISQTEFEICLQVLDQNNSGENWSIDKLNCDVDIRPVFLFSTTRGRSYSYTWYVNVVTVFVNLPKGRTRPQSLPTESPGAGNQLQTTGYSSDPCNIENFPSGIRGCPYCSIRESPSTYLNQFNFKHLIVMVILLERYH